MNEPLPGSESDGVWYVCVVSPSRYVPPTRTTRPLLYFKFCLFLHMKGRKANERINITSYGCRALRAALNGKGRSFDCGVSLSSQESWMAMKPPMEGCLLQPAGEHSASL